MKYSFILPAYKARFLKEAIDSILTQTYTNIELIIVNDASPEDIDSIVNSYDDSRIRYYVNKENIGGRDLVAQWNHCLKYAESEYVILASDDDVYFPQYLEKMDVLVRKYPKVNVFRPRIQIINKNGEILEIESYLNEHSTALEYTYAWIKGYIKSGIPHYIFKKKSLEAIGGFINYPLAWFSDDATVIYLAKDGIVFCTDILFSFRYSGENISTKPNNKFVLKGKLEAMTRFYSFLQETIHNCKTKTINENFYKKYILSNIDNCKKNHSFYLLNCSDFHSKIYNWTTLRNHISLKTIIYSIYKDFTKLQYK